MTINALLKTSYARPLAAAAGLLLTLGGPALSSAHAQQAQQVQAKEDLARCRQLYSTYSRYSGRVNYSHPVDVDAAVIECDKGNTAAGIADLTAALKRANIPLPPTETAAAPAPSTNPHTHR